MTKIIQIIISTIICASLAVAAFAQTAGLMPNANQVFLDNNGNPLASGTVTTYIVGTTTLKTTWQDAGETIPNTNPIVLNAAGRAIIYGDGNYRQVVRDRFGNLIWDALTSAFGTGSASQAGDGTAVGTVLSWSGINAPTRYVFAYGQELSRVTYSSLYTAITLSINVNCSNGSPVLSGISDTTQIAIGAKVEATCIAAGTTVSSKTASTVTVSNNASVTVSVVARFFPWGNGNGATTFNVPDLRGRVLPGRDNMGGTAAARLTTAIYGSANPDALGAAGGAQSHTLIIAELAAHTHTSPALTDPGHTHTTTPSATNVGAVAGAGVVGGAGSTVPNAVIQSATTGITLAATTGSVGSSTPFSIVQPSVTINYIVKVLPDVNISTANVVTSLGGMNGDITCGAGVTCSAQSISITPGVGTGDVLGPVSSDINAPAIFADGTGKVIKVGSYPYINVKNVGALGNGISRGDGAITNGTNAFTSASGSFVLGDIGKRIQIAGAGAAGVPLNTVISGYTSATSITVSAAASTTVSGAVYIYGTDDTTAIQAAIDTLTNSRYPASVWIPNGIYMLSSGLTISSNVSVFGENQASAILVPAPTTTAIAINSSATVKVSGLQINYIAQAGGGAGITLTGPGEGNENSVFRDLQINNPTYGIITNSSIRTVIDNVGVFNFSQNCFAITNPASPDAGDDIITNSNCQDGSFTKTAIYYASSSGLRITNTKFLNVRYCVSVELTATFNVSQMTFSNNGCDGAIAGLRFIRAGVTGSFGRVIVTNNSFNLNTVAISVPLDAVAPWLSGLVVTGNMYKDGGAAGSAFVSINSLDDFYIGGNTLISTVGTTVEAVIGSTATNGILGVNSKTGTFTANTISSTSTFTPISSPGNFLKVASGETALDGTNPTPVTTGLSTIVACTLTIKTTSAPGLSTSVVTYDSSFGTLNMYGWKPTGAGTTTLIASTGTDTIGWICTGT